MDSKIIIEIINADFGMFFWEAVKWVLLVGVSGMILAVVLFLVFRFAGLYKDSENSAPLFRVLILIMMFILCAVFSALTGFFEGVYRGAEKMLHHGAYAQKTFLEAGNAGADIIAALYIQAPGAAESGETSEMNEIDREKLESFRRGAWEINILELRGHIDSFMNQVKSESREKRKEDYKKRYEFFRDGVGEKILEWLLKELDDAAEKKLAGTGPGKFVVSLFKGLVDGAAKTGDPDSIGFEALSAYIAEKMIHTILLPVRSYTRNLQIVSVVLYFLVPAIPPLILGARRRKGRKEPDVR